MSYNTKDVLHITNIIKLFNKNTGHRELYILKVSEKNKQWTLAWKNI